MADELRLKGNAAYKAEDYSHAIKFYDEAIFNYPESHQDLALTYANRAACFLKLVILKKYSNTFIIRIVLKQ